MLVITVLLWVLFAAPARAQRVAIDNEQSALTIYTANSGLFSFLGHGHTISAPVSGGYIETGPGASVELSFESAALRVVDPELTPEKRTEIQKVMQSDVLEVERYPAIRFRSREVQAQGAGRWKVTGELELHGVTRELSIDVHEDEGRYRGEAVIRQTDFGIRPVRIAGGTVSVADKVRIEFEIAPGE